MTQNDLLLAAGSAGLALAITLVDLVLSVIRHRRASRIRSLNSRLDRSPGDEAADIARREWIRRRIAAIESDTNK